LAEQEFPRNIKEVSVTKKCLAGLTSLCALLTACGGGSQRSAEDLALDCNASEINVGMYIATTESGNGDWAQCLAMSQAGTESVMARWTWDDPGIDNQWDASVRLFAGSDGSGTTMPILPEPVNALTRATVDYDISSTRTGRDQLSIGWWNVYSTDGWDSRSVAQTVSVVLVDDHADLPDDTWTFVERATLSGLAFDVYQLVDRISTKVEFRAVTPALGEHRLDLLAFSAYMKAQGWMTGEEGLAFVQLQHRAWEGAGEVVVQQWRVDVDD
jgi:hypothetical protein